MKGWHFIALGVGILLALKAWENYVEDPTTKNLETATIDTLTL